jgi:hypothetical protein
VTSVIKVTIFELIIYAAFNFAMDENTNADFGFVIT